MSRMDQVHARLNRYLSKAAESDEVKALMEVLVEEIDELEGRIEMLEGHVIEGQVERRLAALEMDSDARI